MYNFVFNFNIDDNILSSICNIMLKLGKIENHDFIPNKNFQTLEKSIDPFNEADLNKIKRFRNDNLSINLTNNFVFTHPYYKDIPKLISELFTTLNKLKDNIHPLILSSLVHYVFIYIHPFDNGNTKVAILWEQLILANYNKTFSYINIDEKINNNIGEYYQAINESYNEKKCNKFISFILNTIEESLNDLENKREKITNEKINLSRLLKVMEEGTPMTASEIMNKLNIKSKETLRNSYLSLAIKEGKVYLTNPNKPTSRNQMYYKVNF